MKTPTGNYRKHISHSHKYYLLHICFCKCVSSIPIHKNQFTSLNFDTSFYDRTLYVEEKRNFIAYARFIERKAYLAYIEHFSLEIRKYKFIRVMSYMYTYGEFLTTKQYLQSVGIEKQALRQF